MGKLTELQIAWWLEAQGWEVSNLEAWCGQFDIEASNPMGESCAIEVKTIGVADDIFEANLAEEATSIDVYGPRNYLVLRVLEAAGQLRETQKRRVAVVVVDEVSWFRFEVCLRPSWIDWTKPNFYENNPTCVNFSKILRLSTPNNKLEMKELISPLNELWIVRAHAFEYELYKKIRFS